MNNARANWIDTFSSFVQFYPKLTAAIAFGTMAAAGRMVSASQSTNGVAESERIPHVAPPKTARRPAKAAKRKKARRTTGL